jgi:hypothetical protein
MAGGNGAKAFSLSKKLAFSLVVICTRACLATSGSPLIWKTDRSQIHDDENLLQHKMLIKMRNIRKSR